MKICVPVKKNEGLKSQVYGHFGSAPVFAFCDTVTGKVEFLENSQHGHEHGKCNPISSLAGKEVEAVFVGGIGLRALERLNASGIKVYRSNALDLTGIMERLKEGKLREITAQDSCSEHNCH
ncbi:MAG: NifB/NifX family molybdenum-iron cluster-binding protein [Elusimicrobiota bacterium]